MTENDVHGPIDFVLIEFSADRPKDEVVSELVDLVDRGTIRLYDLVVLRKDHDGSVSLLEIGGGFLEELMPLAGARSGLLGEDDQQLAAGTMEPGTTAVLLVYENAWAVPFVAAARRAGGELVAAARISAQDVIEVVDELEAAG
jgi:hypothetical protein